MANRVILGEFHTYRRSWHRDGANYRIWGKDRHRRKVDAGDLSEVEDSIAVAAGGRLVGVGVVDIAGAAEVGP
ncbi:MAG TPA: hypothetical protein VLV31_07150 [Candidatus Acidoferrales bacterium]|nr:hypothetical protein [Candidatus Acidoferrales bacterium]